MEREAMTSKDELAFTVYNQNTREVYNGLTAQEYAAIVLRVPDSGEKWLDDMIRRARRMDAVQAAMQGLLAAGKTIDHEELNPINISNAACNISDAAITRETETWRR